MANFDSNYAIAQEISARIGTSPIPFESVYSICLEIYQELGGEEEEFDSVYAILLEILPLASGAGRVIDDTVVSSGKTWSSEKISTELIGKQDVLSAGTNISISGSVISAIGYKYSPYLGFTEGGLSVSSGQSSHAEGSSTLTKGSASHSEGNRSKALGNSSHAEGDSTVASGHSSHAEGSCTTAYTNYSHAEGRYTQTSNDFEHAEGAYNVTHKGSIFYGSSGNTQHSIGIGTTQLNDRKNAVEVMQNGDMYIYGIGGYQGINTKVQNNNINPLQNVISGINTSIAGKQDTLTAGTNIQISGTTISATYQTASTAEIEALFS